MVSVVIATRDRPDELRAALRSCREQCCESVEVHVFDDASTNAQLVAEIVAEQGAVLHRSDQACGVVLLRNQGLRVSRGRYVIMLDDDCYFTSTQTITKVIAHFNSDASAWVIALPLVEPFRQSASEAQCVSPDAGDELRSFLGGSCAMVRDSILSIGGYPDYLLQGHEERDLAFRILLAGGRIIYGDTSPIVHTASQRRNRLMRWRQAIRNAVLISFLYEPWPVMILHIPWTFIRSFLHGFRLRDVGPKLLGMLDGICAIWQYRDRRSSMTFRFRSAIRRLPLHHAIAPDVCDPQSSRPARHNQLSDISTVARNM